MAVVLPNSPAGAEAWSEATLRDLLADDPTLPQLCELLQEEHELYDRLDSFAVIRIRGALLLALQAFPREPHVWPFVREELESAHDAYLTAAAAHVLRSVSDPDPSWVDPLLDAMLYIRYRDDRVRLGTYGGYGSDGPSTTAMTEVLTTLGWLRSAAITALPRLYALRDEQPGPRTHELLTNAISSIETAAAATESAQVPAPTASCCGAGSALDETPRAQTGRPSLHGVEFQDHTGELVTFDDYFVGQPTIVVFFYTRCENPTKCPLTISTLGRLQQRLLDSGTHELIRTAAITYDPHYDLPPRLDQFGRSWGAQTGPNHRLLRTTGDLSPVREFFGLGVSYGPSVVNRHRLEAYVLDAAGQIVASSSRRRWTEHELLATARRLA